MINQEDENSKIQKNEKKFKSYQNSIKADLSTTPLSIKSVRMTDLGTGQAFREAVVELQTIRTDLLVPIRLASLGSLQAFREAVMRVQTIRADLLEPIRLASIGNRQAFRAAVIGMQTIRADLLEPVRLASIGSLQAFRETAMDLQKIRADFEPIRLVSIGSVQAFREAAEDWQKIRANLYTAPIKPINFPKIDELSNYVSAELSSELIGVKFNLSQAVSEMNELSQDLQSESEDLEKTNFQNFSEEHIQFILNSLEEWLEGSISYKSTLERIEGNKFAHWLMQTIVYGTVLQFLCLFAIFDDQQLQRDRTVVESIQYHLENELVVYKQYKKYFDQSEKWATTYSIGLTRKEVRLREGKSKTAPVTANGVVGQKTVVIMFETKNNWRRIEVKMNDTHVQGWVPESMIIRLNNVLQE